MKYQNKPLAFTLFAAALAAIILGSELTWAYIPNSQTIIARMVKNNGKGAFLIEQDVQFRTATEPVTLRERWIVENGENMRLLVSSPVASGEKLGGTASTSTAPTADAVRFEAIYRDGKRVAPDLQGGITSGSLKPEFIESFFHARSNRGFNMQLLRSKIVPASFLRERPKMTNLKEMNYSPEALMRLGRSNGVINWVIGEATPADSKALYPGAWIEQDVFALRRLRFPSSAEVYADHYNQYSPSLRLPRERTITWGSNSVLIRTISVKTIPTEQASRQIDLAVITNANAKNARLPDLEQIKEFYSRFR